MYKHNAALSNDFLLGLLSNFDPMPLLRCNQQRIEFCSAEAADIIWQIQRSRAIAFKASSEEKRRAQQNQGAG